MEHHYGGLSITAPFTIDGIRPGPPAGVARGAIAIALRQASLPPIETLHFDWPGRYQLQLGETADGWIMRSRFDGAFLIDRDGRRITLVCETLPPSTGTIEVLVRRVLPRVAVLFGATALHSAALGRRDGALLLLGASGAGKSTTSAALAHFGGFEIFSDDISILWPDEAPQVSPATTGVCVWPESREGLDLPLDQCSALPAYGGKLRYHGDAGVIAGSVPIKAFVFLDRSGTDAQAALAPLDRAEAISEAIPQIIQFNPQGWSAAERVSSLGFLTDATRIAHGWRLRYPAGYAALPDVVALLERLLD